MRASSRMRMMAVAAAGIGALGGVMEDIGSAAGRLAGSLLKLSESGRPSFARYGAGYKPGQNSQAGAVGTRECDRRRRQIVNAQLRVHRGPSRILHHWIEGSTCPTMRENGLVLKAWWVKAKFRAPIPGARATYEPAST